MTVLLLARRRAAACDAWLDLVCPQPLPRKVIRLTGLDAVFVTHDTVADAVDAQEQRHDRPQPTTPTRDG